MSQQGLRQASARAIGGSAGTYNEDLLRMFDAEAVPAGAFNERQLMWINTRLVASYVSLPEAQQAFAVSKGAANWSSLGTLAV